MTWGQPESSSAAWLCTSTGHRIELLPNRVYVFGRGDGCDFRVDDSSCSRRHARLSVSGDVRQISLQDMQSKNGTFVNGNPIRGAVKLESGDRIQIGETEYTVSIHDGTIEVQLDTRTQLLGDD